MEIKVLKNVLLKNNAIGEDNRKRFKVDGVFAINILSSPGAGKTTLLENSLEYFIKEFRVGIIEGDLYTSRDAERLQKFDIPIVQINTEGGCHLDARMVYGALSNMKLNKLDLIFIENVGNLVCPASFDLGENITMLIYSVTEGQDKPLKYANIFKKADIVLINKVDLADLCRIDLDSVEAEIKSINNKCKIFRISAVDKETLKPWAEYIMELAKKNK